MLNSFFAQTSQHHCPWRPIITISYAQSLDGSIAANRNIPLHLSSRQSLVLSHVVRSKHDALLVGIGTILSDNPHLNVRLIRGKNPQPVILDSTLRFPVTARVMNNKLKPWIFTTKGADLDKQKRLENHGVRVVRVKANRHAMVDLRSVLKHLKNAGIRRLLVEGGARTISSFFGEHAVDHFVITIAPKIVGGLHAIELPFVCKHRKKADVRHCARVTIVGCKRCGKDVVIWGKVNRST